MNKLIFTLLLVIVLAHTATAQKSELKIMYSPISLLKMDTWDSGSGAAIPNLLEENINYSGAFIIDYNYCVSKRLKVGGNITYDYRKTDKSGTYSYPLPWPNNDQSVTENIRDITKDYWLMFGPQLGYDYIRNEKFSLGSLVGLSFVWNTEKINGSIINSKTSQLDFFFHVEALNFLWGKKHGLTGQLGFGHKGLVSLGYFFKW
jgi:hypothetical protein